MPNKSRYLSVRACGVVLVVLSAWLTSPAFAQVIFQRERLEIAPPPVTEVKEAPAPEDKPTPLRATHSFNVEVRGEEALQLEYIHTLNNLGQDDGVMISFSVPSLVAIPTMKVYQAVDVLFISDDGIVLQILPDIIPAEINRDIEAKEPVRAFLYLRAGEAKRRDIRPRDVVSHAAFNAKPLIIQ